MYIDTVPNRNSPPAILLRESYGEGGKVKKRTIVNLSKLPRAQSIQEYEALLPQKLTPEQLALALPSV